MSKDSKLTPLDPIDFRAVGLVTEPFPCANCGNPFPDAQLFCSQLCRAEARYVRQYRSRIHDGTIVDIDVREALKIKLAHILAGGYNARLRRLSLDVRRAVFENDQYRCRNCGARGSEVDHICGSSSDVANLQLLCFACHRKKTMRHVQRVSRNANPDEWAKAVALDIRAKATEPLRLCDGEDWERFWRTIVTARRRALAVPSEREGLKR